jgi:hypothetical protein
MLLNLGLMGGGQPGLPNRLDIVALYRQSKVATGGTSYLDSRPICGDWNAGPGVSLAIDTPQTITFAGIGAGVTVTSHDGTATVALSSGTLSCSVAGSLYNLTLSDGTTYTCAQGAGWYVINDQGNGIDGALIGFTLETCWTEDIEFGHEWKDYSEVEARVGSSRNLTNTTYWAVLAGAISSYNQVGLDGIINTASLLTDQSATTLSGVNQFIPNIPNDSATNTAIVYIKKDSDVTRFPEIEFRLTGGTQQDYSLDLNTSTGESTSRTGGTGTVYSEVNSYGDWWQCLISVNNNSTGNTTARIIIYPALGTIIGVVNNDAQGSIIIGNVELYHNKTIDEAKIITPQYSVTNPIIGKVPQSPTNPAQDILGNLLTNPGVGTNHLAVTGYGGTFAGATEYLTNAGLVGTETVVTSIGTSTPTVSAGRIDFDAGWCSYILLSNGDEIIIESRKDSVQPSVWDRVNGNEYVIVGATLGVDGFWSAEKSGSLLLDGGFTEGLSVGGELVANSTFANWTDDDPDNYVILNEDASNYITEHVDGARLISDNTSALSLRATIPLTTGDRLVIKIVKSNHVSGSIRYALAGSFSTIAAGNIAGSDANGEYTIVNIAESTGNGTIFIYRDNTGNSDYVLSELSCQVVPLGQIPASLATGLSVLDQPLTNTPGQFPDAPILVYANESKAMYDEAVLGGIETDWYTGGVANGLTPAQWAALVPTGNLADAIFYGTTKDTWFACWNPALTGTKITQAENYMGI